MLTKASLILNCHDQNGLDVKQSITNINTEKLTVTDTSVVESFKQDCKEFGVALNGLTTNTLISITIESVDDITSAGE